jgi:hypothetical protein
MDTNDMSSYLLDHSLKLLRFSLESHIAGSFKYSDGKKWGNTWISALGIERMMHGVEAIEKHLNVNDKELLKNVLISARVGRTSSKEPSLHIEILLFRHRCQKCGRRTEDKSGGDPGKSWKYI